MFRSQGRMLEFFVTLLAFSAANARSANPFPDASRLANYASPCATSSIPRSLKA